MPADTNISTKPAETTMVGASVGLLNSYEYYNAYKNSRPNTGYLNNGYYWWLLNPNNASYVRHVINVGAGLYAAPRNTYGVRPSINLKSDVKIISGSGTESDPYVVGLS
jgi:hypothetical protein